MSSRDSNVCGNCANFKPRQGDKFFNCTFAKQGGVAYAMQVRADTRSCEAFSALGQPPKPPTAAKPAPKAPVPQRAAPSPPRLCSWGRLILVAALIILIVLIAWGVYTLVSHHHAAPAPTPTPTPAPTAVGITPTPVPTATPIPVQVYSLGTWARSSPCLIIASDATKQTSLVGGPAAAPNTFWVEVTVTVQNIDNSGLPVSARAFMLWDSYGTKYPAVDPPTLVVQGQWFPYQSVSLDQGQLISGTILYQVPTAASGLRIVCLVNGQYLEWTLGF